MSILSAGCGDNVQAFPDGKSCGPILLPTGPLADPDDFALPSTCVIGGMSDPTGRWFVTDSSFRYIYGYPRFENQCGGVQRVGIDDFDQDGLQHTTWSDGTTVFLRDYARYPQNEPPVYEFVSALAACIQQDGSLAAQYGEVTRNDGIGEPLIGNRLRAA